MSLRLARPTVVGWALAVAAMAQLVVFVAKLAGSSLTNASGAERVLTRLGAPGASTNTFLGVAFLILAVMIAFVAAGLVGAARTEEAEGRLEHLVVQPVSRSSWLLGRLLIAVVILVMGGLLAGFAAWLGVSSQRSGASFATMIAAGLNVVPPAICVLGAGELALGVLPRATSLVASGVLAWSILVELVGGVVSSNRWLLDTSVFHQMVPAASPNWMAGGVLVGVRTAAALAGGVAFRRRDIVGE